MRKKKWKANSDVQWDDRTFLRRNWLRLAMAAIVLTAVGMLYHRYVNSDAYLFGVNTSKTQREIADCMNRLPHQADDSEAADDAASACVNGMTSDKPDDK